MKTSIIYRQTGEWFVGHLQQYPDYESQGASLEELKENLRDIFCDIQKGLVPDAKPAQVAELVI